MGTFATRFGDRLPALIAGAGGCVHVAAWELGGQGRVLVDADRAVRAASTIKVPILLAALGAVEAGRVGLDDRVGLPAERAGGSGVLHSLPATTEMTLADLLTLMVIVSDNTATNAVIDTVGMDAVARCCDEVGLTATRLQRRLMDLDAAARGLDNHTSALDQALLLEYLATGPLPGPLREFAFRALHAQQFRDRLPALLPAGAVVANKTGELPGLRHDVGLLTAPDGRRAVVAVLVDELPVAPPVTSVGGDVAVGPERATMAAGQAIAEIGLAAWAALTG